MNDLKPHRHGEEGTHSCCDARLKKEGGKATCCECSPHEGCGEETKPNPHWQDRLQFEIIEDYIHCAKMGYAAKDDIQHKEEMRKHWEKLNKFISELLDEERRRLAEKIENMYRGQRKIGADMASFQPRVDDMDFGYNDAIEQVLALLKNTNL